jgi:hypothetical protein
MDIHMQMRVFVLDDKEADANDEKVYPPVEKEEDVTLTFLFLILSSLCNSCFFVVYRTLMNPMYHSISAKLTVRLLI